MACPAVAAVVQKVAGMRQPMLGSTIYRPKVPRGKGGGGNNWHNEVKSSYGLEVRSAGFFSATDLLDSCVRSKAKLCGGMVKILTTVWAILEVESDIQWLLASTVWILVMINLRFSKARNFHFHCMKYRLSAAPRPTFDLQVMDSDLDIENWTIWYA